MSNFTCSSAVDKQNHLPVRNVYLLVWPKVLFAEETEFKDRCCGCSEFHARVAPTLGGCADEEPAAWVKAL